MYASNLNHTKVKKKTRIKNDPISMHVRLGRNEAEEKETKKEKFGRRKSQRFGSLTIRLSSIKKKMLFSSVLVPSRLKHSRTSRELVCRLYSRPTSIFLSTSSHPVSRQDESDNEATSSWN